MTAKPIPALQRLDAVQAWLPEVILLLGDALLPFRTAMEIGAPGQWLTPGGNRESRQRNASMGLLGLAHGAKLSRG